MNYHVEHHLSPIGPYHELPKLHEMSMCDLHARCQSICASYGEMRHAFIRQLHIEDYFVKLELPPTATPYRDEFHSETALAAE